MEWDTPACSAALQRPTRRKPASAQDSVAASPMDCDIPTRVLSGSSAPVNHTPAQVPASSAPPLELSGVPSTRIEDCLEWLAGHTHFSPRDSAAAIRQLHSKAPLALQSGGDDLAFREQRYQLLCDTLRSIHGVHSLPEDMYGNVAVPIARIASPRAFPVPVPGPQQSRPDIPPGFESRAATTSAAQQAAKAALAGLTITRRSGRSRKQPTKWWLQQEEPQHQEHRRNTRCEGPPVRRPSQP